MITQLLRTIIIIVIAYYLIRLITRYILPLVARYFIRKTQAQYQKQTEPKRKKSGEINIEFAPERKGSKEELGEYIDYEEINEEKTNKS